MSVSVSNPSCRCDCSCGAVLSLEDVPEGTTLDYLHRFAAAHVACGFIAPPATYVERDLPADAETGE